MAEPILKAEAVTAGYVPDLPILREVSIAAERGKVTVIIGPNGAGKSTLIKAIAGLVPVSGGRIVHDGQEITNIAPDRMADHAIAYVPQSDNIFRSLTIFENLKLALRRAGPEAPARLADLFAQFPVLADKQAEKAGTLSGGQRQFLAVAMALAVRPRLILMDEPSAGLSPKAAGEVLERTRDLTASGVSILLVEQNVSQALRLADHCYILAEGRNQVDGAAPCDLFIESAGPGALRRHGAACLARAPLWSVGGSALIDGDFHDSLDAASRQAGTALRLFAPWSFGIEAVPKRLMQRLAIAVFRPGLADAWRGPLKDAARHHPGEVNFAMAAAVTGPGIDATDIALTPATDGAHRIESVLTTRAGRYTSCVTLDHAAGHPTALALIAALEQETVARRGDVPAISASFSSRAFWAMARTASNSSRVTKSRSASQRSIIERIAVSASSLAPCATPMALVISCDMSSMNLLRVCIRRLLSSAPHMAPCSPGIKVDFAAGASHPVRDRTSERPPIMLPAAIPFPDLSPELFSIEIGNFAFALRWYALAYIAGILIGWRLAVAAVKRPALWPSGTAPMTPEQVEAFLTWLILGIVLGGRLGYVLFYQPGYYLDHPGEILMLWQGGMAFHGGVLGVALAGLVFCWRHGIPVLRPAT